MSVTLTAAARPEDLVPGDVLAVSELASQLRRLADGSARTAASLRSIELGSWVGEAADAFRDQIGHAPKRLDAAVMAFSAAAQTYDGYAETLYDARTQAGRAVHLIADADAATAAWTAAAAVGTDPGERDRERARALLAAARSQVHQQGAEAGRRLSVLALLAPDKPGMWSRVRHAATSFVTGVAEASWDLGKLGFAFSPTHLLIDPKGYVRDVTDLGKGVAYGAQHPVAFAKAVSDWDTWAKDPARALGHLVPNLVLTVATAGAGGAAKGATAVSAVSKTARAAETAATTGMVIGRDAAVTAGPALAGSTRLVDAAVLAMRHAGPPPPPPPRRQSTLAGRLTRPEITQLAQRLGYRPATGRSESQPVFSNGKDFITQDFTSHKGGVFKKAKRIEDLKNTNTRAGTYDHDLNWIAP